MFEAGYTLQAIALSRRLELGTIITHLEELVESGRAIDLSPELPNAQRLHQIQAAFTAKGEYPLQPSYDHLNAKISYNELRLARLHLRQSPSPPPEESPDQSAQHPLL